jgi:hypothetical protein
MTIWTLAMRRRSMTFCPECGTENDDSARFCKSCGRQLTDVAGTRETPAASIRNSSADDDPLLGEDLDGEPGGERLLWRGRPSKVFSPLKALTQRYKVSNERIIMEHGFISRRTEEIDLYRVNDVAVKQNIVERIFGFGDIIIQAADVSSPSIKLINVVDPDRVKDLIRQAARTERQRRRVLVREEF